MLTSECSLTLAHDPFSTCALTYMYNSETICSVIIMISSDGIFTYMQYYLLVCLNCWSYWEFPFRSLQDHGFCPFKLPTYSPLQKGWDHSLPKAFLEESSSFLFFLVSRLFWILCILQARLVVEVQCVWACWGMVISVQLSTSAILTTSKMIVLTALI